MNLIASSMIFGFLLLFLGRKLFWLMVGLAGFWVGMHYSAVWWPQNTPAMQMGLALFFGIMGAVLAMAFEWAAVMLAGFGAGGYLSLYFVGPILDPSYTMWMFLAAGVIGMVVMYFVFDRALILISAVTGAALIVTHLSLAPIWQSVVFIGLAIGGAAVQYYSLGERETHLAEPHPQT